MLYSPMIQKAAILAFQAHEGQLDKNGYPYIMHPLHLAEEMNSEEAVIVALLHDTVEDTAVTIAQLQAIGFSDAVIDAVQSLTHEEGIPYDVYVQNLSTNPLATKVKLADLKHNSDPSRLATCTQADQRRMEKYRKAIAYLQKSLPSSPDSV